MNPKHDFSRAGAAGRLFVSLLVMMTLAACSSSSSMREPTGVKLPGPAMRQDAELMGRVAVFDFYEGRDPQSTEHSALCRITGMNFIPGDVESGAGEEVANKARYMLRDRGFNVLNRDEVMEGLRLAGVSTPIPNSPAVWKKIGDTLHVDAIVLGSVMRYEERQGSAISVDRPSSVSFSFVVFGVKNGEIAWKAKFEKTQQALFSNVLDYKTFFKGGMVWQKAEQLSIIGMNNLLDQMPLSPVKTQ